MSAFTVLTTGVIFLIPGIGIFLAGYLNRKSKVERVQVPAYVVEFSNWTRPKRVVFDYPLPNGQWTRQTRMAAFMPNPTGQTGLDAVWIKPGYPFHVYVDPNNPHDVSLGAAGAPRVLAYVAMVAGGAFMLMFVFANAVFLRG